jgi:K+-sensing histidine kinase KdpD
MNALTLVPAQTTETKRPGRLGEHATLESVAPVVRTRSSVIPASQGKSIFPIDTASALVHDLKSPLAALTMNLEFALSELPEAAQCNDVREALHDCRLAGARLFRMVTNLLDIARGEAGKLVARRAPVSVRALLQSIAHATLTDPRARNVSLCTEGYEGEFELDADLMVRVLDCLMDAALSGACAGGKVTLSARLRHGELELRVPTLGSALSPEQRAVAFSKHSRLSAQGFDRGLSLYFCRVAVEAHGGGIALHEADDHTSFFRIVLPSRRGASIIP